MQAHVEGMLRKNKLLELYLERIQNISRERKRTDFMLFFSLVSLGLLMTILLIKFGCYAIPLIKT